MKIIDSIMDIPNPNAEILFKALESSMEGLRQTYTLLAAVDLGIFEKLKEARSIEELSCEGDLDKDMMQEFCDALWKMDLLERNDGKYSISGLARTYLISSSPYYQKHSFDRMKRSIEQWQVLTSILHNGPVKVEQSKVFGENWIEGIAEHSMCGDVQSVVEKVSSMIDMNGEKRLLDLGGGHGLYAIAFCTLHPGMKAIVFDQPNIIPVTMRYIARYDMHNVGVMGGDFNSDDIGRDYDVIFSSLNSSGSDIELIPKIRDALKDDGMFVIRQPSIHFRENPLTNMEWNFFSHDGKSRRKRFSGPQFQPISEYQKMLEVSGFSVLKQWPMGTVFEMLIAKKNG